MKKEKLPPIILKKLDLKQAEEFFLLHAYPTVYGDYFNELYIAGESGKSFTQRLLWLTKCAYTIRLKSDPAHVIGSCLIYRDSKHGNEHFLGGTLLPVYRNKTLLLEAFNQIRELAKYCYGLLDLKICEKSYTGTSLSLASPSGISVAS